MKILLLEDDEVIANSIKEYFELFDKEVNLFENAKKVLEENNITSYDILLLDINTPGMSGIELLGSFREMNIDTPAIFITAMNDLEYIKEAYKVGCDDYIKKPFDIEELELRINYLVKQRSNKVVLIDGYSFDMKREKLFKDKREIILSKNEQRLLYLLIKNRGESVSNEVIINYIWNNKNICDNTLRTMIKKIRDKLDSNLIVNIRGSGI